MGKLDPDDPRPPFRQIADTLREAIESGELAPGEQLPSLLSLSGEYGVSMGTVKSALSELRDAGLIVTRQGKGSYVRTHRDEPANSAGVDVIDQLRQELAEVRDRLAAVEKKLAGG